MTDMRLRPTGDETMNELTRLYAEKERLRTIIGCFVSIHGTHPVPDDLRELASSCAFKAVSGV